MTKRCRINSWFAIIMMAVSLCLNFAISSDVCADEIDSAQNVAVNYTVVINNNNDADENSVDITDKGCMICFNLGCHHLHNIYVKGVEAPAYSPVTFGEVSADAPYYGAFKIIYPIIKPPRF